MLPMRIYLYSLIVFLHTLIPFTAFASTDEVSGIKKREISLEEAISIGLKNSYSTKILQERINQSLFLQRKALALLLPLLSAQGSYTRYDKEIKMSFPDLNSLQFHTTYPYVTFNKYNNYVIQKEDSFGAYTSLSVPIFNAPNYLTYKNAQDSVDLSKLNLENQRGELIYNISVAYLSAVSIKKGMAIAKNSVGLARAHLEVVEARYKNGDANELSLTKARLDLERAQNDSEKMEKAYKIALESLSVLMGTDEMLDVTDSVDIKGRDVYESQQLLETALRNRTDIRILKLNQEIIKRDINITKSKFLPTLNMNATYRYSDVTGFIGEETQWFIILSLNLTLYDGGIRYAEMQEKRSRLNENLLQLSQINRQIRSEIEQNLIELQNCKRNILSLQRQLDLARKTYTLSLKSYEMGVISQSDLIDSEVIVTNTELLLEKEKNDCNISLIKLLRTTGELNSFTGK